MNLDFKDEDINDEIDLKVIASILLRNKKFIIIITLISSLIGSLIFLNKKTIWQGSFNILINESIKSNDDIKGYLLDISNALKKDNKLNQQVFSISEILKNEAQFNLVNKNKLMENQKLYIKSQKVLFPAFENFQKDNKKNSLKNSKISFETWKNNFLQINSEENSFLLSVKYQSQNKEHTIKTLNLIKNSYKNNFKKTDKTNIVQNIQYLKDKSNYLKKRSSSSFNKLIFAYLDEYLEFANISLQNQPWKNISKINIKSITNNEKSFPLEFIYFPIILTSLVIIIKENINGNIYEIEVFKKYISYKLIEIIYKKDLNLISNIIEKNLNLSTKDKFAIIYLTNEFNNQPDRNNLLKQDAFNLKFIKLSNIDEIKNFERIILIAVKGKINTKNLKLISNYLILYKEKIDGWYMIDC